MRSVSLVLFAVFVGPAIIILSIIYGVSNESWSAFWGALVVLSVLAFFAGRALLTGGRKDMRPWLAAKSGCKYSYGYDGYGIAIDIDNEIVYVVSKFDKQSVEKSYPFSDIREWGYEMPGHTQHVAFGNVGMTAAAQVGALNTASMIQAANNTGFWLKVRDIEFPRWFFRFGGNPQVEKKMRPELDKWMEIFNQHVNKQ